MIELKLGWSNPDCGPMGVRLYALDQGDQPRWASPHARVAEVPLVEAGAREGQRFVLLSEAEHARAAAIAQAAEALVEHGFDVGHDVEPCDCRGEHNGFTGCRVGQHADTCLQCLLDALAAAAGVRAEQEETDETAR